MARPTSKRRVESEGEHVEKLVSISLVLLLLLLIPRQRWGR